MALRRQGLSQRRKAVGLTQESLAQRLGVERSTVVRWEAGDTEPLPSIRPHVARALQVSIDQLAELLAGSENAETTRALPADAEVTIPILLPEVQAKAWPGRAESGDLILPPQVAEAFEELRRALRSAGAVPEDLDVPLLGGKSSRMATRFAGSDVPESAQTKVLNQPSLTAIPLDVQPADVQWRRARSRRFKRFAAVGVLVLAGGAASVPFITSRSGPIPPAAAGIPVPATTMTAAPVPNPVSSNDNSPPSIDSSGVVHTAPAAAPNKSADGLAPPAAAVPAPHTIRSDNRTIRRPKPPASTTKPSPPRPPATPAEAYAWWAKKAGLSASDQRRTRPRPEAPQRP